MGSTTAASVMVTAPASPESELKVPELVQERVLVLELAPQRRLENTSIKFHFTLEMAVAKTVPFQLYKFWATGSLTRIFVPCQQVISLWAESEVAPEQSVIVPSLRRTW